MGDATKAKEKLGWEAYLGLKEMVTSSYKYAVNEKNRVMTDLFCRSYIFSCE